MPGNGKVEMSELIPVLYMYITKNLQKKNPRTIIHTIFTSYSTPIFSHQACCKRGRIYRVTKLHYNQGWIQGLWLGGGEARENARSLRHKELKQRVGSSPATVGAKSQLLLILVWVEAPKLCVVIRIVSRRCDCLFAPLWIRH